MNEFGLANGGGIGGAAGSIAPSMTRAIYKHHAIVRCQTVAERQPHISEIDTRTMQQDDRTRIGSAEFDNMKPTALDLHKPARRRVSTLDITDYPHRRQRKGTENASHHHKHGSDHSKCVQPV